MNLSVQIVNAEGAVIWAHGVNAQGDRGGITSKEYRINGELEHIAAALSLAAQQVSIEGLGGDDSHRMADGGRAATQV